MQAVQITNNNIPSPKFIVHTAELFTARTSFHGNKTLTHSLPSRRPTTSQGKVLYHLLTGRHWISCLNSSFLQILMICNTVFKCSAFSAEWSWKETASGSAVQHNVQTGLCLGTLSSPSFQSLSMLCSNLHQSDKLQTLKTDAFKYAGEISDAYRAQPRLP